MASFVQLPQILGAQPIDYSPISRGIESIYRARRDDINDMYRDKQMDMEKQRFGMEQSRFGMQQTEFKEAQEEKKRAAYARLTQAASYEKDPQRRALYLQRANSLYPDMSQRYGDIPDLAQAESGINPLERQMQEAQLGLVKAQTQKAMNNEDRLPVGYKWVRNPETGEMEQKYYKGGPADPAIVSARESNIPSNVRADAIKVDQAYETLNTLLDRYKGLVAKGGTAMASGQYNDAVQQARRHIQLQLKELENLGVLNGPDLQLMNDMVGDPSLNVFNPLDLANAGVGYALGSGTPANRAVKSIDRLKDELRIIRNAKTRIIGLPPAGDPSQKVMSGPLPPEANAGPKEGDIAYASDGRKIVLRNNQWVPLP